MYRFFEKKDSISSHKIFISKENSHHIINVLRIRDDEDFEIVIDGLIYLVNIYERQKNLVKVQIKDTYRDVSESKIKIHLYQGLPKSDKLELIIQKCIELGVYEITPFISSRTIVKWDEKKEAKKLRRYEEIALAAAKQAKRSIVPKINPLCSFETMLEQIKNDFSIIAYEEMGERLKSICHGYEGERINIIIGPEGGFSAEEVDLARKSNAKVVNLGKRILRTETAAIALTAMVQYEIGDINEEI